MAKDETDGLDQHLMEGMQEEEGRKKKKKRKREKNIKIEPEEEMDILRVNENVAEIPAQVKTEMPFEEGGVLEEKKRKKKKKKKKDSEQDEVEEFMGKTEPADSWSNDVVEGSNKKKKKKKKSKMDAD